MTIVSAGASTAPTGSAPAGSGLADPRGLAGEAPLLAAWLRFTEATRQGRTRPFTIPGHKQRTHLTGTLVEGDVPLFGGLDTVGLTVGRLAQAERLAAEHWGADWARFSVGGATHGNQALTLALGRPGDRVVVSRTLHRSLLTGLALAGLDPVWVRPGIDPESGLPTCVPVDDVRRALATDRVCGVFLTEPSYVGTCGPVREYAEVAHEAGVPLVVDAAWGAHFGAHPDLPPFPLRAGADAVVISAHKSLPAMNQAAVVLARTTRSGGLLSPQRLESGFDATHTTSPSGSILASIDAARALLQRDGRGLFDLLLPAVRRARTRLAAIPGVRVLAGRLPDGAVVDPVKLVVCLAGTGANGLDVGADLDALGLPLEMADLDTLIPMITIADSADDLDQLVTALGASIERHRGAPRAPVPAAAWSVTPRPVLSPREAHFAEREALAPEQAVGRTSAELIAPYPPGVPVLAPGEQITAEVIASLRAMLDHGGRVAYAADPALATLQVVRDATETPGRRPSRSTPQIDQGPGPSPS
ncbi:aminotransferase class I/II-fold pyridoxal phosphate-dependent enzyme [Nocardioides plantarum]|uniref:Aminotransferase class I/II-fold pyridoxal phosphate-dependent enzyme n=1 Tax=Nocardioides plantarum TaxID=29299 RepID=A0ABV5KAN6_9ACTN|nr:aminotransferase class V-fold PLP-dependent enzyme [Nocardioides plantarum]